MTNRIAPYLPAALQPAPPAEYALTFYGLNRIDLLMIDAALVAMKAKHPGCSAGKALTEICAEFAQRDKAK